MEQAIGCPAGAAVEIEERTPCAVGGDEPAVRPVLGLQRGLAERTRTVRIMIPVMPSGGPPAGGRAR